MEFWTLYRMDKSQYRIDASIYSVQHIGTACIVMTVAKPLFLQLLLYHGLDSIGNIIVYKDVLRTI